MIRQIHHFLLIIVLKALKNKAAFGDGVRGLKQGASWCCRILQTCRSFAPLKTFHTFSPISLYPFHNPKIAFRAGAKRLTSGGGKGRMMAGGSGTVQCPESKVQSGTAGQRFFENLSHSGREVSECGMRNAEEEPRNTRNIRSSAVPTGLLECFGGVPTVETVGYCQMPLRGRRAGGRKLPLPPSLGSYGAMSPDRVCRFRRRAARYGGQVCRLVPLKAAWEMGGTSTEANEGNEVGVERRDAGSETGAP
jgi:hypothetical protein